MNANTGRLEEARTAFSEIYEKNLWRLGPGLELEPDSVQRFVRLIQDFMRENEVATVAEFGCGYWVYSKLIDWKGKRYDGYDVVESAIRYDTEQFSEENIHFHLVRDGIELSGADLLICKDVFQHLPSEDIIYYIGKFKKIYKYMIITNDVFPDAHANGGIPSGGYRAIRLDREPFNERCAVLQTWEGVNFGERWTKHTCLLFGDPTAGGGARTVLNNHPEFGPGASKTVQRHSDNSLSRIMSRLPSLARSVRQIRAFLR
ncbi:hypothetical protein SAMN05444161_9073 [Rhizobiales bacterium GAS191]|nr:hypothetical protein SAMN05444161_9073 [Rhizobiales bacterium GAS191]